MLEKERARIVLRGRVVDVERVRGRVTCRMLRHRCVCGHMREGRLLVLGLFSDRRWRSGQWLTAVTLRGEYVVCRWGSWCWPALLLLTLLLLRRLGGPAPVLVLELKMVDSVEVIR